MKYHNNNATRDLTTLQTALSGPLEKLIGYQGPPRLRLAKWLQANAKLIKSIAVDEYQIPAAALAGAIAYEALENPAASATVLGNLNPQSYDAFAVEQGIYGANSYRRGGLPALSADARAAAVTTTTAADSMDTVPATAQTAMRYIAAIMNGYAVVAKDLKQDIRKDTDLLISLYRGGQRMATEPLVTGSARTVSAAVGYLTNTASGYFPGNLFSNGSGFLITPYHVLTVAHNFWSNELGSDTSKLKFVLPDGSNVVSSTLSGKVLFHPDAPYGSPYSPKTKRDLAIVTLSQPVIDVTPLRLFRGVAKPGEIVNFYGYPPALGVFPTLTPGFNDVYDAGRDYLEWLDDGVATKVIDGATTYETAFTSGHSGGPVTVERNGLEYAAAVIRSDGDGTVSGFSVGSNTVPKFDWLDATVGEEVSKSGRLSLGTFEFYLRYSKARPSGAAAVTKWVDNNADYLRNSLSRSKTSPRTLALKGDLTGDYERDASDAQALSALMASGLGSLAPEARAEVLDTVMGVSRRQTAPSSER